MSEPNPNKLRIKPTYDVSTYGEDVTLNLGTDNARLTSITMSTSNFGQVLENGRIPIDELKILVSNEDTWGLIDGGDNTAFDKSYEWTPDMSAVIYKIGISSAFGLIVSAFTSGSFNLDSVRLIITQEFEAGEEILLDRIFNSEGLTALTGTGSQILLLNGEIAIPGKKIVNGVPISFRLIVNETSGSGTRQVGILPIFCFQSEAIPKQFTTSVLKFHVHASLDHAFPVFRTQNDQELLDYSGVGISG